MSNRTAFISGVWQKKIDVRDFVQKNYLPFEGDSGFLAGATSRTEAMLEKVSDLIVKERENGGVLDVDPKIPSGITSHEPGFIDRENEVVVGLQTDAPLKRAIKPKGGVRLVQKACAAYGFELDSDVEETYSKHVKTHNDGVFEIYKYWGDFRTPAGKMLRSTGLITGLPDNYGRGRIIGDYRRVALYGIDRLIEDKIEYMNVNFHEMTEKNIHARQEIAWQIKALEELKVMGADYGFDLGRPAEDFREAVQWLYLGYLAAVKEQDGAAMSMGKIDAFLDIYAERDLKDGVMTESEVQEVIDDFVLKLRIVKQLRVPEYNEIFAGDPTWVTCVIGGMGEDGRSLVTKTSMRMLHTLVNLGPAPEPNLTVLWSKELPENFKNFASEISIKTSALQFESDDLMRPRFGDDYGIACCVSAMRVGKEMQFFGARCNLPKLLLMAINEGRDEFSGDVVKDNVGKLENYEVLDYEEVKFKFYSLMKWLARVYVDTMNIIHYVHDRNNYENIQMALHDSDVKRFMAFGVAGISIVADSLSAIKHAKVKAVRNEEGIAVDFEIDGDFPTYGSDEDSVDEIAVEVVQEFMNCLRAHKTYRDAEHTLSLLTITSNVMYGKKTGATPDGRGAKEPFAPGANPMHNRDKFGAVCSLNSVAKIPYEYCLDGISNTFSIDPASLGKTHEQKITNLRGLLDGYFVKEAHHLNVNVLDRDMLLDAMENPQNYPNLTIRVSGYAVRFISLSADQQKEVVSRTFHSRM